MASGRAARASRTAGLGPLLWLMLVIGALLFGGYLLWTSDTRRGSHGPAYSVTRTDERGAAAVFRLYHAAGLKPKVWDRDLSKLKAPGLLILLAPARAQTIGGDIKIGSEGDLLPYEIEALDKWVAAGNVAVVMTGEDNDLYQALGLIAERPEATSKGVAEPTQPSLLAREVNGLETDTNFGFKFGRKEAKENPLMPKGVEIPQPIQAIPTGEWLTLFEKKQDGRTVAQVVSAVRGKGLYVCVNSAAPASNTGIAQADNARFMLNLARLTPPGGSIWFDEYHKRNVDRSLVAYLRERSLAPLMIYALLLVGLGFWRTGLRLGAPEPLVADERRDSGEYIRAIAELYRNAKMSREALGTIFTDFRKRLIGALRMDGLTDLEEVARRYEQRTGRPGTEARQALIDVEAALANPKLDDAQALQYAARLTELDQALHRRNVEVTTKPARKTS
jgi:hypothetical protein